MSLVFAFAIIAREELAPSLVGEASDFGSAGLLRSRTTPICDWWLDRIYGVSHE